jgi:hypothetical protein
MLHDDDPTTSPVLLAAGEETNFHGSWRNARVIKIGPSVQDAARGLFVALKAEMNELR